MYLSYRSIGDLNDSILTNLNQIPHDIDLVVGIPRSGMLPANLIALYLNKPFADIDSFLDGRFYTNGRRGKLIIHNQSNKILVVDDSVLAGNAMMEVKNKLISYQERNPETNFLFGAVYVSKEGKRKVDFYCEVIEGTRVFQWNIFHHPLVLPKTIMDIDGVLCPNPPIDDDGSQYLNYISNAPALYIPTVKVDKLVSCRLEKYRAITEDWLKRHHVLYGELVMLDFKTKEERVAWGKHGQYKGQVYKESDDVLFIESSLKEAREIFAMTRKPVFCTENFKMMNDDSLVNIYSSVAENLLIRLKTFVAANVMGEKLYHLFENKNK